MLQKGFGGGVQRMVHACKAYATHACSTCSTRRQSPGWLLPKRR